MRLLHAARLSQVREGQTGMESADKLCESWADQNGHTIVKTTMDHQSGTTKPWDRPKLRPWVTDPAKIAQYDGIIAYRLDRLSRGDDESTSEIEKWARENNKVLLTEDGLIFPCEGVDGIRWDVTKRIAHEEWLKASERYRRMQAYLRENGFLTGRPPFGFKVIEKGEHKTLAVDPVTGPILVQAIDMYLSGKSLRAVCLWLDTQTTTPQGGKWQGISLSKIFKNECLIGKRKDAKGKTILKIDRLISDKKFADLQAMLNTKATRKGIAPSNTAMLTSILQCGNCGAPMYRSTTHGRSYYRCHGNYPAGKPCGLMVKLSELDDFVSAVFAPGRLGNQKEIEQVVTAGVGYEDEIAEVEAQIRELDLDDAEFASKQADLMAERKRLKSLPSKPTEVLERETGRTWHQVWISLDDAGKRAWLTEAGMRVLVRKKVEDSAIFWAMDSPYLALDVREYAPTS